jgi:hypothetical protein
VFEFCINQGEYCNKKWYADDDRCDCIYNHPNKLCWKTIRLYYKVIKKNKGGEMEKKIMDNILDIRRKLHGIKKTLNEDFEIPKRLDDEINNIINALEEQNMELMALKAKL